MNFNFSFSSNIGNKSTNKRKLSAQEEYWLDRILRNHSTQIFVVIVLFFALILSSVIYSILNPTTVTGPESGSNRIEINGSRIIISQ